MSGPSTRLRLWLGAGLCLLPLGLVWSATPGFLTPGFTIYGDCGYSVEEYCTLDTYIPGAYLPGQHVFGAQASARVFVVFAALVLAVVAARTRTPGTRRLARAGTVAVGIAAVLAAANHAVLPLVCLLAALALTAPPAWRRPGRPGVLARGGVPG
jgi:hypothetical protein